MDPLASKDYKALAFSLGEKVKAICKAYGEMKTTEAKDHCGRFVKHRNDVLADRIIEAERETRKL